MSVGDIVVFRGTIVRIIGLHANGADLETARGIQFVNVDPEELKPAYYD